LRASFKPSSIYFIALLPALNRRLMADK